MRPSLRRARHDHAGSPPLSCAALLVVFASAVAAQPVDVGTELARLQATHGFDVSGSEHLEDALGRAEGDDVYRRLRVLLEGFDHIIVQAPGGGVEKVLIVGRTNPAAAPITEVEVGGAEGDGDAQEIELPTVRDGNQHSVQVTLEGAAGKRIERVLLIDTGADTVVLPASLIEALGIAEERLAAREVQTANGTAEARMGMLPAVWLDGQRVGDVTVAFLDDDKLGGKGLLGMSVLGRYQMTIDDENDRLTLTRR
jgi:clan AA aspartic protease (TIGR02281 family)